MLVGLLLACIGGSAYGASISFIGWVLAGRAPLVSLLDGSVFCLSGLCLFFIGVERFLKWLED